MTNIETALRYLALREDIDCFLTTMIGFASVRLLQGRSSLPDKTGSAGTVPLPCAAMDKPIRGIKDIQVRGLDLGIARGHAGVRS